MCVCVCREKEREIERVCVCGRHFHCEREREIWRGVRAGAAEVGGGEGKRRREKGTSAWAS